LEKHAWEKTEIRSSDSKTWKGNCVSRLWLRFFAVINTPWKWHNPDSFRLALKTAMGMVLASLFVSIQYLYEIAAPFAIWPGLTIGE
jgi:hypothetical protein